MYGSLGKTLMELIQTTHHLWNGTYVIYQKSNRLSHFALAGSLIDKGMRRAAGQYIRDVLNDPKMLFSRIYWQSIGIVQGPDMLADGRMDMCESCPDMTVWNGTLVHSCRMDEWRLYGAYVDAHPNPDFVPVSTSTITPDSIPVENRN